MDWPQDSSLLLNLVPEYALHGDMSLLEEEVWGDPSLVSRGPKVFVVRAGGKHYCVENTGLKY